MLNIVKFCFLLVPFMSVGQDDSLLLGYVKINTKELQLTHPVIDSLLSITVFETNESKLKSRVLSYTMYIGSGNPRYISVVINTNSIDLSNERFIGFFCKDGYRVYCFGEGLMPLFSNVENSPEVLVYYKKPTSNLDYLIDSNLIDERKTMKETIILNDVKYDLYVESVPF
jgi:hypothetical protein